MQWVYGRWGARPPPPHAAALQSWPAAQDSQRQHARACTAHLLSLPNCKRALARTAHLRLLPIARQPGSKCMPKCSLSVQADASAVPTCRHPEPWAGSASPHPRTAAQAPCRPASPAQQQIRSEHFRTAKAHMLVCAVCDCQQSMLHLSTHVTKWTVLIGTIQGFGGCVSVPAWQGLARCTRPAYSARTLIQTST